MRAAPALAIGLLPVLASAEIADPPLSVAVAYDASATCPSQAELMALLRRRAPRIVFTDPAHAARRYRMRFEPRAGGYHGELVEVGEREVVIRQTEAETCDGLADALTLIVALMLDPEAAAAGDAEAEPEPPAVPPLSAAPRTSETMVAPSRWLAFVEADVSARVGFAPRSVLGVPIWLSLGRGFWSAGVGFERTAGARAGDRGSEATLIWTAGRLRACRAAYDDGRIWDVSVCAQVGAGVLSVSDLSTHAPSQSRFWADAGVGGLLTWRAADPLGLALGAGLSVPITHYYLYAATPEDVVYSVPSAGAYVAVGVLFRLE